MAHEPWCQHLPLTPPPGGFCLTIANARANWALGGPITPTFSAVSAIAGMLKKGVALLDGRITYGHVPSVLGFAHKIDQHDLEHKIVH